MNSDKTRKILILTIFSSVVILATLYFWYTGSHAKLQSGVFADSLIAFGRLAGLFLTLSLLAELLMVSRAPFFETLKGFPGLNRIHHFVGLSLLGFLVLHGGFIVFGYALSEEVGIFSQLLTFFKYWEGILPAVISAFFLLLVGLFSVWAIKQKFKYEIWYVSHLLVYPILFFSFSHQIETGDMSFGYAKAFWILIFGLALGFYAWHRFGRPIFYYFRHRFRIESIKKETENTFSVYMVGNNMDKFKFASGQYANFIFFQKGFWFHHPFSFSAPFDGKHIRITAKELGDATDKLRELRIGTRVIIDGPMGNTTLALSKTKKYFFVSGGVGITPIAAMIFSLSKPSEAVLFYASHSSKNAPLLEEIKKSGINTYEYFSDAIPKVRIDAEEIMRKLSDILERDAYICGPQSMIESVTNGLIGKGMHQDRIHSEKFDY